MSQFELKARWRDGVVELHDARGDQVVLSINPTAGIIVDGTTATPRVVISGTSPNRVAKVQIYDRGQWVTVMTATYSESDSNLDA